MGRSLTEWLGFQQSIHSRSIDLELSRVATVARRLGVDRLRCPVVTVGGTNGKGSVVAHLDSLLCNAGLTAGVFTSPHVLRYNERIKVGGIEAADAELVAAFERIEQARGGITLTYFEYNTLAALSVFAARAVDIAILEVGLGGRLDATNIIDASVAVVCSIGFDHRDYLGETLEHIGREKAGIFRAGRPAVLGSPDMPASVFAAIAAIGAQPMVAERDFRWNVRADGHWSYRGPQFVLDDLPPSSLAGAIQYRNAATAIAAIEALFENRAPSLTLPREAGEGRELLLLPPPFHGGGAGWGHPIFRSPHGLKNACCLCAQRTSHGNAKKLSAGGARSPIVNAFCSTNYSPVNCESAFRSCW